MHFILPLQDVGINLLSNVRIYSPVNFIKTGFPELQIFMYVQTERKQIPNEPSNICGQMNGYKMD